MKRSPVQQFIALLFAVLVAVSIGASTVKANDMAVDMAVMTSMSMPVQDDCGNCFNDDMNTMSSTTCAVPCTMPAVLSFPTASMVTASTGVRLPLIKASSLFATGSSPEPYPPRSIMLG